MAHRVAHMRATTQALPGTASLSARVRLNAWDAAHNGPSTVSDRVLRIVDPLAGVRLD